MIAATLPRTVLEARCLEVLESALDAAPPCDTPRKLLAWRGRQYIAQLDEQGLLDLLDTSEQANPYQVREGVRDGWRVVNVASVVAEDWGS
jgi:hypothetical protein